MKKLTMFVLMFALALVAGCSPSTANATPTAGSPLSPATAAFDEPAVTCASEGYTGTKLEWCRNICERGYTGATLDMWIHRWVNRYRDLPYCAIDSE